MCLKTKLKEVLNGCNLLLGFLDRSRYYSFQVAPQLYSRGWVDPVPDPLLLKKSGSGGNRTRDFWICSQEVKFLINADGSHLECLHQRSTDLHCTNMSRPMVAKWFQHRPRQLHVEAIHWLGNRESLGCQLQFPWVAASTALPKKIPEQV
jgi:hypothetical protein